MEAMFVSHDGRYRTKTYKQGGVRLRNAIGAHLEAHQGNRVTLFVPGRGTALFTRESLYGYLEGLPWDSWLDDHLA